jgi:hypothetical protein
MLDAGVDVNSAPAGSYSALDYAAIHLQLPALQLLLARGASREGAAEALKKLLQSQGSAEPAMLKTGSSSARKVELALRARL